MNKRLAALPLAVLATFGPAQAQATHALRFYGNGVAAPTLDRVVIRLDGPARPVDVGAGDFSLEFWMKANPGDNTTTPCSGGEEAWINGSIILDRDIFGAPAYGDYGVSLMDGVLAFGVAGGGGGNTVCGGTNLADGVWHHLALTRSFSTGELRVFVDGQPDGSAGGPTGNVSYLDGRPTPYPYDPCLVIGAEKHDAGAAYPSFRGWIDEVRVSTVIRYSAAFQRPSAAFAADAGTAALYHFDEGAGDSIGDASGAPGGPSDGTRRFGGSPAGPVWTTDHPFADLIFRDGFEG